MSDDVEDLRAALEWGATLELSDEQRTRIALCHKIAGVQAIPSWRLKEEADKRRAAEARVAELERPKRWWHL